MAISPVYELPTTPSNVTCRCRVYYYFMSLFSFDTHLRARQLHINLTSFQRKIHLLIFYIVTWAANFDSYRWTTWYGLRKKSCRSEKCISFAGLRNIAAHLLWLVRKENTIHDPKKKSCRSEKCKTRFYICSVFFRAARLYSCAPIILRNTHTCC